jgi:hypothetical protein
VLIQHPFKALWFEYDAATAHSAPGNASALSLDQQLYAVGQPVIGGAMFCM